MRMYRFSTDYGMQITRYQSKQLKIAPILQLCKASLQMSCMYIEPGYKW
ncbi:hypothetical protein KM914_16540 [Virgibacillus pantothenticus]|nr:MULTISPECIES: hypothetical protein [Virgibacillus]MBS7429214.1 hypothetical protein [Virgibacillus sp. 19R1-5]MBU8568007.1 hypothetical protein [Virgibacillus pantothenticus]MBU8601737.1 hypothetical protein [Virgibacillus pantothenticus]MBU8636111.1 hypothetical protein [Virgibacillus pantothenticus]MBU8643574.1 hypothetical protein [Virgibacillus pantothenticus]